MMIKRLIGAGTAAVALAAGSARADYTPIATGGVERVVSYSLSADGSRLTIVKTHTFTNTEEAATFTLFRDTTVDVLVVGGGGGGSYGGGGGGEVVYTQNLAVAAGDYIVNVGSGGEGVNAASSSDGEPSSVFAILAFGGKRASADFGGGASGNGNAAGTGIDRSGYGGGGGVGAVGANADGTAGGAGGAGVECTITGESRWYGGGGGGGSGAEGGSAGLGVHGGGNGGVYTGSSIAATAGVNGTGGGGGGGGQRGAYATRYAGNGGSGIVIVRYTETVRNGFDDDDSGDSHKKVGGDMVHTYTETGVTNTFSVPSPCVVELLVVAGGGGGGKGGGGGGAGGLIHTNLCLLPGEYSICVGAGGGPSTNGVDSFFGDYVAIGGGKGGHRNYAGASGGSGGGGGGCHVNDSSSTHGGGTATAGQGNAGGTGTKTTYCGGGGGGAGGAGNAGNYEGDDAENPDTSLRGKGGPGLLIDISGEAKWYAAGGGGGFSGTSAAGWGQGGSGIGGNGGYSWNSAGTAGAANTGSGGGGGGQLGSNTNGDHAHDGGAGGSGIVIIRHRRATINGLIINFR